MVELPADPPSEGPSEPDTGAPAGPRGPARSPELPDAPFVEDTAVLLDGFAVLARPAGTLRRRELPSVEQALAEAGLAGGSATSSPGTLAETPARIHSPGLLEGGDVLPIGRRLFVGLSRRTNEEGLRQLQALVEPHGYRVTPVLVSGALHLKTAVTHIPVSGTPGLLIANPQWVDLRPFRSLDRPPDILPVPPEEPFAANTLTLGDTLLVSAAFPRTRRLLERRGVEPHALDLSELEKAEAGLTCLSLRTPGA